MSPKHEPSVEAELQRLLSGGDPDWIEEDTAALYDAPALDPAVAALADEAISRFEQPDRDAHAAAQQRRADALADVDAWHGAKARR